MIEVDWNESLFAASRAWIGEECTPEAGLASASGISRATLGSLEALKLVPRPTYALCARGVSSPVARMGQCGDPEGRYYGPAVVTWLRRCAAHLDAHGTDHVASSLRQWLRRDLEAALRANAAHARSFGWTGLFDADGELADALVDDAAGTLWDAWLGGGWAVCLNRFDGHHVVVKDLELERIPALAAKAGSDRAALPDLVDAMLRYDSLIRPFAPFERAMSSRRRVIDDVAEALSLPWLRRGRAPIAPEARLAGNGCV